MYDKESREQLWESKSLRAALSRHAALPSGKVAVAGYQEEWIAIVDPETLSGKVWMLPAKLQEYGGVWSIAAEGDELFVSRRDDSVVVLNEAGEMLRRGLASGPTVVVGGKKGELAIID